MVGKLVGIPYAYLNVSTQVRILFLCKLRTGEHRKTFMTQEALKDNGCGHINKKSTNNNFFEKAVSIEKLLIAWAQLKSNLDLLSSVNTEKIFYKINLKWFETTNKILLKGNFQYPRRRRLWIFRFSKTKLRPLAISNLWIKIIEKALLNSIEPFFEGAWEWFESTEENIRNLCQKEFLLSNDYKRTKKGWFVKSWFIKPVFKSCNHGFRQGRSPHSALKTIKEWSKNVVWLLDYDIKKAFDNVNRGRLKNIFLKYLNQPRIWLEIEKMINVGFAWELKEVVQGSVLVPFLLNVYMTEFDRFVTELSSLKDVSFLKPYLSNSEIMKEYSKNLGRYYSISIKPRQIFYTRYGSDFIIGIIGLKSFAIKIKNLVNMFLKSNLHLNIKKDILINRNSKGAKFLNYLIYLPTSNKTSKGAYNKMLSLAKYKRRVLARLRKSDEKLAKSTYYDIRRSLLAVYRKFSKSKGAILNKINQNFVINFFALSFRNNFLLTENPALKRWIKSSKDRSVVDLILTTKYMIENIKGLPLPLELDSEKLQKVKSLKEQFINGLNSLSINEFNGFSKNDKEKVLKAKKKMNIIIFQSKTIREQAIQLSNTSPLTKINTRSLSIIAPLKDIYEKLREAGFFHKKINRPCSNNTFIFFSDFGIVNLYSAVMHALILYYRAADNFNKVKSITAHLRKSCLFTLARKHKKNIAWAYKTYGNDVEIITEKISVKLPTRNFVFQLGKKFLVENSSLNFDFFSIMKKHAYYLGIEKSYFNQCAVKDCFNNDIEVHHVRKFKRKTSNSGTISVISKNGKFFYCIYGVLLAINCK